MGDSTVRLWDMRGLKSAPCCGTDTDKDCDDGGSSKRRRVDRNGSGSSKDSSGGAEATHSGKVLIGHQGPVFCLDMSTNHGGSTNDTQFVLSGGEDCTVKLWSCKDNLSHFTQTPLHSHTQVVAPTTVQGAPLLSYKGHNYPVWDVSFSPVGFYFASASMDSTCRLWSTDRVYPLRVFTGHSGDVEVVEFHPNSNYLATGGSDGTVRVWDIQSGKCVRVLQHHGHRSRHAKKDKRKSRVTSLAFSPFGRYLASGCDNGVICMWDIGTGLCYVNHLPSTSSARYFLFEIRCDSVFMSILIFLVTSCLYLSMCCSLSFTPGAGTLVDKYIGHTRSITSLSFSRDMHHHSSAVACIDSESDSDAPRSTLNQHLGSSGGLLASASLDCTIKLWSSSFSADPSSSSLSPFSQSLFSDSQIVSTVPAHFPSVSLAIGQSADQILLADDAAKGVQSCPSLVQTFYSKSTPLQYLAFTPRNLLVTAGVFSK